MMSIFDKLFPCSKKLAEAIEMHNDALHCFHAAMKLINDRKHLGDQFNGASDGRNLEDH